MEQMDFKKYSPEKATSRFLEDHGVIVLNPDLVQVNELYFRKNGLEQRDALFELGLEGIEHDFYDIHYSK